MNKRIYLDYAATTPVDSKVFQAMKPYFMEKYGNPMSVHGFGQESLEAMDKARTQVAEFLNCSPSEVIFTSGATESNNLVVKGVIRSYYSKFPTNYKSGTNIQITNKKFVIPHIITTRFEHHCVLDACKRMENDKLAEITYLTVSKDGVIRVEDVKKAIRPNTILISMMYVNNEIGTVQPIAEIGKLIKKYYPRLIFHTDATQGANYFDCDVNNLGVDLLSMSAHKIYGPKGIGMLYVKTNTPIRRVQDGGDQEYKMRSGTHNVPGIVGLGKAVSMISEQRPKNKEILKLRDYLIKRVLDEVSHSHLNGSKAKRSPNNANFRFDDVEGEGLVLSLDMEGIAASTGSACSSGALEPSHVLLSLGLKPEQAHGSLRLTLGKYTTKKDVDTAIGKLKEIIKRLRKISGGVMKEFN
ncbi:cysteine desulfurase [bacterium BMS3Abin15]|nr:cysteine desulfurase [bacterium BMS3Abin15]HDZ85062.1 cysteine desulfurase [Candidatus Moranbacteria bacterium]